MMKCKRLRNESLRNEEWFQFLTEFKDLVSQFTPQILNIEERFNAFSILYQQADEALEVIRKSEVTAQIAESDNERNVIFRGFANAVKSALNHFDPAKQQAAVRLQIVLDQYGNIAHKPYADTTASLYNFLQEMNGSYADDIRSLALGDWVAEMENKNSAFETLMVKRYSDETGRTSLRMKEVRTETDRAYRDILDKIDALVIVNGEASYSPFIQGLNTRITHYHDLLAQRTGRHKKAKAQTEQQG